MADNTIIIVVVVVVIVCCCSISSIIGFIYSQSSDSSGTTASKTASKKAAKTASKKAAKTPSKTAAKSKTTEAKNHECPKDRCPGIITYKKMTQDENSWSTLSCEPSDKTKKYKTNKLLYAYFDKGQNKPADWGYPVDIGGKNCFFDSTPKTQQEIEEEEKRNKEMEERMKKYK